MKREKYIEVTRQITTEVGIYEVYEELDNYEKQDFLEEVLSDLYRDDKLRLIKNCITKEEFNELSLKF